MCIIVDANRLGAFLADPAGDDAAPLRAWVDRGGRIVYSTGGAFGRDLPSRIPLRFSCGEAWQAVAQAASEAPRGPGSPARPAREVGATSRSP